MKKLFALIALCFTAACANSNYVDGYWGNYYDPIDQAADLGNRGREYVGMGEVCDNATGGNYRETLVNVVREEHLRIDRYFLDLVNRAYRGHATQRLERHMQSEMAENNITAIQFCDIVVERARVDLRERSDHVNSLYPGTDAMQYVRNGVLPPPSTPSFNPDTGYQP